MAWVGGIALALASCGNKETNEALAKASKLDAQKQYVDANQVLVDALTARKNVLQGDTAPADQAAADALKKKVQADPEYLTLERAQIPLYLKLERSDMASVVYTDILAGSPNDRVIYDELKDTDPVLRAGASRVLGLLADPAAIQPLAQVAKDPDQDVRRAAVSALGSIKNPGVVPPLIAALKDPYWFVRSEAATALGQKGDGSSVRPLLDAVNDSDISVATASQTSLVYLCDNFQSAVSADDFADALKSANPKVVLVSAICLAILKDKRAVPALTHLIDSPDAIARLDAVKGLGQTGDPSVIPILRDTLKNPDRGATAGGDDQKRRELAINVRGWSIIGLGQLRDGTSLPELQALATDDTQPQSIRDAAAAAVRHIQGDAPTSATPGP
jgi:HEAT repeat protein